MQNEELILITGASGFLGARVVRELLDRQPQAKLALFIRDSIDRSAQHRANLMIPPLEQPRVRVYSGDVAHPRCGLDNAAYHRLKSEATRIIHCAATVRFDLSLKEARAIHVEGTRNLLELAADAPNLRSFTYVGTAYVAGERTGLVLEDELVVGQTYRNTYEQTKAESEALVREAMSKSNSKVLPAVILRPSIIVGDSQTGATSSFKMLYWPLKVYARRLWRTVPGYPDAVLDIVPVDFVARAVAYLAFDPTAIGSTLHLCAGPPTGSDAGGSATIAQIAERASQYFNLPEPRYVDPNLFFATIRLLLYLTLWGNKRRSLKTGRAYRDYFSMRMQFDTSNARRYLEPAGMHPRPVLDYLDSLFEYCVSTNWGRKPYNAGSSKFNQSPQGAVRDAAQNSMKQDLGRQPAGQPAHQPVNAE